VKVIASSLTVLTLVQDSLYDIQKLTVDLLFVILPGIYAARDARDERDIYFFADHRVEPRADCNRDTRSEESRTPYTPARSSCASSTRRRSLH
jgi:hypothetical protein